MKKVAYGTACGLVVIFIILLMLTLYGRYARQDEADIALSQAIDDSLSYVMDKETYTIENHEQFASDLMQTLAVQLNSTSGVRVAVLEADMQTGILSVEITQSYKHPNGNNGKVSEVRTVILEKMPEQTEEYRKVSFYMDDATLYKEKSVLKGTVCTVPDAPMKEGKTFGGWVDETGNAADFTQAVTENKAYYAVFD